MNPRQVVAFALAALVSACEPERVAPRSGMPSYSGTWDGSVSDPMGGHQQSARLVLRHTSLDVSGTYQPQQWGTAGSFYGTTSIDGTMLDFVIIPSSPSCSGSLTGTGGLALEAGHLELSWSGTTCNGLESWNGVFERQ